MDFPTYNSNNIHQQQRNNNYQRLQTPQYLPHPGNYGYQQQFNQMNYQPPPLPLPMQPQNNFQSHSQYRPPFHPRNGNHLQQHPNHPNHNRPNQIQYANNNQHNIVQKQSFRCEPCERDFTSHVSLLAHQKQHVKCEVSGCEYTASSKAVKLHFIQTHEEGKFRIVLTTPQEIEKWREERRKNWPSKKNIESKKQQKKTDQSDGIELATKEFTYRSGPDKKRRNGGGIQEKTCGSKKSKVDSNNNINEENKVSGLSLLQSYGDENDDDLSELIIGKSREDGELEPSEDDTNTQKKMNKNQNPKNKRNKRNNRNKNNQNQNPMKKKASLLEMLLAKEIRHERNVILQCVRYIVEKNFFLE